MEQFIILRLRYATEIVWLISITGYLMTLFCVQLQSDLPTNKIPISVLKKVIVLLYPRSCHYECHVTKRELMTANYSVSLSIPVLWKTHDECGLERDFLLCIPLISCPLLTVQTAESHGPLLITRHIPQSPSTSGYS